MLRRLVTPLTSPDGDSNPKGLQSPSEHIYISLGYSILMICIVSIHFIMMICIVFITGVLHTTDPFLPYETCLVFIFLDQELVPNAANFLVLVVRGRRSLKKP